MKSQEHILSIIESFGTFEMEFSSAMSALNTYLLQLEMIESGKATISDFRMSEKRHDSYPTLISSGNIQQYTNLRKANDIQEGTIALLKLQGTMFQDDGWCHDGVGSLVDNINFAMSHPNIKGVLLKVNSGGGESTAGTMLQSAINDSTKPIVAFVEGDMASAAVRACCGASAIIATDGARIGSIGTYLSIPKDFVKRRKESGYLHIYADESTNKNKAIRDLEAGDMTTLKAELNKSNAQFLSEVRKRRTLKGSKEQQAHTLSGAMFSAEDAYRRGLITQVGSYSSALAMLNNLISNKNQ